MPFSVFIPCKYLSADFVISNAKFFHFSRKATEGDGTLAAWKKAHRKAFAAACEEIGRNFDESMKCVCEYFDVVYRADGQ